jgi:hypothetical protein
MVKPSSNPGGTPIEQFDNFAPLFKPIESNKLWR